LGPPHVHLFLGSLFSAVTSWHVLASLFFSHCDLCP
jgi:hypothetical protein